MNPDAAISNLSTFRAANHRNTASKYGLSKNIIDHFDTEAATGVDGERKPSQPQINSIAQLPLRTVDSVAKTMIINQPFPNNLRDSSTEL